MFPQFCGFSTYSLLWVGAFLAGWFIARVRAQHAKIPPRHIDNIALLGPIAGYIGAILFGRLLYSEYTSLHAAFQIWNGGPKALFGGLCFGFLALLIYSRRMNIQASRLLDLLAPSLAIGIVIGKIGCFAGGCCWGDICIHPTKLNVVDPLMSSQVQTVPSMSSATFPYSIRFPLNSPAYNQHKSLRLLTTESTTSLPVHPVQLYEAGAALLLFAVLLCVPTAERAGTTFMCVATAVLTFRFILEFLRGDNSHYWADLTVTQLISLAIWILLFPATLSRFIWPKGDLL